MKPIIGNSYKLLENCDGKGKGTILTYFRKDTQYGLFVFKTDGSFGWSLPGHIGLFWNLSESNLEKLKPINNIVKYYL